MVTPAQPCVVCKGIRKFWLLSTAKVIECMNECSHVCVCVFFTCVCQHFCQISTMQLCVCGTCNLYWFIGSCCSSTETAAAKCIFSCNFSAETFQLKLFSCTFSAASFHLQLFSCTFSAAFALSALYPHVVIVTYYHFRNRIVGSGHP